MPELKHNILRFGYGVNFRYEDLNLTLFQFDYNYSNVVNIEKGTRLKSQVQLKKCLMCIIKT